MDNRRGKFMQIISDCMTLVLSFAISYFPKCFFLSVSDEKKICLGKQISG